MDLLSRALENPALNTLSPPPLQIKRGAMSVVSQHITGSHVSLPRTTRTPRYVR